MGELLFSLIPASADMDRGGVEDERRGGVQSE